MLGIGTVAKKIFGTPNDRKIKATRPLVEKINALEPEFEALSDEGLIEKTQEFKKRIEEGESVTPETLVRLGLTDKRDRVKILGDGDLSTKLDVSAHAFSASAKEKIEAAGGSASVVK